jgi:hypothetical protein
MRPEYFLHRSDQFSYRVTENTLCLPYIGPRLDFLTLNNLVTYKATVLGND